MVVNREIRDLIVSGASTDELKEAAIRNVSTKLLPGGFVYSVDPHQSSLRFIFDFLMRLWRLWEEEASEHPLLSADDLNGWMGEAGIAGRVSMSTYLPPHVFVFGQRVNIWLLQITDSVFRRVPLLRNVGGVIVFEGRKQ